MGKAYEAAITTAWGNPVSAARRAEDARLQAGLARPGGMLALYRAINAPGAADRVYRSDFGAALTERSPQGFGRSYVGYWETRNLRMVANIRDVLGRYPVRGCSRSSATRIRAITRRISTRCTMCGWRMRRGC